MLTLLRDVVAFFRKPSSSVLILGAALLVLAMNEVATVATSIAGAVALLAWTARKLAWVERQISEAREQAQAESRHRQEAVQALRERISRVRQIGRESQEALRDLESRTSGIQRELGRVTDEARGIDTRIDRTREQIRERKATVDGAVSNLRSRAKALEADTVAVRARAAQLEAESAATTDRLDALEAEGRRTAEIALETGRHLTGRVNDLGAFLREDLGTVPVSGATDPLLSIAIPSFNRPEALAVCLQSIVDQLDDTGRVEVWVTDDASPDVLAPKTAHRFAVEHPEIGFVPLAANIGLERNLIRCLEPCRGRFVLILGNDDFLLDGALDAMLADLEQTDLGILLYEKTRFSSDLSARLARVPGSTPIEIGPGERHRFDSPFEAAQESGLLSAFGFISQVVFLREPFVAVDADPFFGLTMYPQVAVLLAAFADHEVGYHNLPIVAHRTNEQATKLVETMGRPEETFMTGGDVKASNWFGPTLAAMLQRAADAGGYDAQRYKDLPERLFSSQPLVDWIEHNVRLAATHDVQVPAPVAADARRFFEGIGGPDAD